MPGKREKERDGARPLTDTVVVSSEQPKIRVVERESGFQSEAANKEMSTKSRPVTTRTRLVKTARERKEPKHSSWWVVCTCTCTKSLALC